MEKNSKLTKIIRTAITPVSLGWHGVAVFGIGAGFFGHEIHNYFSDPETFNWITLAFYGGCSIFSGSSFYTHAFKAYLKTRKNIKKYNSLDEESLKDNYLKYYCTRQGSRTAAINAGLGEEYDEIKNKHQEIQWDKWIPHW